MRVYMHVSVYTHACVYHVVRVQVKGQLAGDGLTILSTMWSTRVFSLGDKYLYLSCLVAREEIALQSLVYVLNVIIPER